MRSIMRKTSGLEIGTYYGELADMFFDASDALESNDPPHVLRMLREVEHIGDAIADELTTQGKELGERTVHLIGSAMDVLDSYDYIHAFMESDKEVEKAMGVTMYALSAVGSAMSDAERAFRAGSDKVSASRRASSALGDAMGDLREAERQIKKYNP